MNSGAGTPWQAMTKYERVAAAVRAQVQNGALRPGGAAPSGQALARLTGYSTLTCRHALRVLIEDGVLVPGASPNARPRVPARTPEEQGLADAARALSGTLAARRRAAGLTQQQLAEVTGDSVTAISHAETGRLWHSRPFWERAGKALDAGCELLGLHDAYQAAQAAAGPAPGPGQVPPWFAAMTAAPPGHHPRPAPGTEEEGTPAVNEPATVPEGTGQAPAVLLTDDEHEATRQAGLLHQLISDRIVGHGRTREADLAEVTAAVHVIQRAIMAQAAARAYPGKYRLLGEEIPITGERYGPGEGNE